METTVPGKRRVFRLSREKRVADIMAAARDVFREKGHGDALLSEIAERANVVEGSIYRYFDNKRTSTDSALEYAQFMLANMARTRDAREGFAAFNEKRSPNWTAE